jgi:hypothetical protein
METQKFISSVNSEIKSLKSDLLEIAHLMQLAYRDESSLKKVQILQSHDRSLLRPIKQQPKNYIRDNKDAIRIMRLPKRTLSVDKRK